MQTHEILAWLSDGRDALDDDQFAQFTAAANDIARRYPGPDDRAEAEAALTTAYRLLLEDPAAVIGELARDRHRAELGRLQALAGLRQAALQLIGHDYTEAGFARAANVDRMAVRTWRGK